MHRWLILAALTLAITAAPVSAAEISGQYIEARTCDVFTGPCFANADMGLIGKHAVLAWKVDKGALDDVSLDGLSVVAVIAANDTLGMVQTRTGKALLIVDEKATTAQRAALIRMAQRQAGNLLKNIVAVNTAAVDLTLCECKGGTCAKLAAGPARIETRCLDLNHDRGCGNESDFFPPLTKGVKARAAMAIEHSFFGKGFNETWRDLERRGAYVGSFEVN
jgi:hypothetical protein